jgi:hypothetical protein
LCAAISDLRVTHSLCSNEGNLLKAAQAIQYFADKRRRPWGLEIGFQKTLDEVWF